MIVAGFCQGEDANLVLMVSEEMARCYKWLATEVSQYTDNGEHLELLDDIRREQTMGIRGFMFSEMDEDSGEEIFGFVQYAGGLDG